MGSIRKRGEHSWEITISLGFGPDGKRIRRTENVKGTKAQAKERMLAIELEASKGVVVRASSRLTVEDWLRQWFAEYIEGQKRDGTVDRYRGAIEKHILPAIGHIRLKRLTQSDVRRLESDLVKAGQSAATVEKVIHTILTSALKAAMKDDILGRNVASLVTPPKNPDEDEGQLSPPTLDEVRRITKSARETEPFYFPAIHVAAYTGLRRGEVLGLHWHDVDLDAGRLRVEWSLRRTSSGLRMQRPKTKASRRTIDLDADTVEVLRAHRGAQVLSRAELEGGYEETDLVFPDAFGQPMNPMALTRAFQRAAKRVGVKQARIHNLRHFHATDLLQHNVNPKIVQERMGHKDVQTTFRLYAHVMPGWQREAITDFADRMRGE